MDEEKKIVEEKNTELEDDKEKELGTLEEEPKEKEDLLAKEPASFEEIKELLDEEKEEEPVPAPEPEVKEPKVYDTPIPRPEPRMKKPEWPNVLVYREGANPDKFTGQVFYSGDDGLPYANEHVLLVADGLGGSMRHLKFNRGLFEPDEVYDALFGDMYGEKNPLLEDYVVDSFAALVSQRNIYDEKPKPNINRVRKSGHFASRIVSSIFLNQVLNGERDDESFYNYVLTYLTMPNKKAVKKDFEKNIYDRINEIIHKEMKEVAERAHLEPESEMFRNVPLLPTTLTATIFNYNKETKKVEAMYFQAGDSRSYVLGKDGLKQVVLDQEAADGKMTNTIRANYETAGNFFIETQYHEFEAPCILFNASDGCFDVFINSLAFELVVLEKIVEAEKYEDIGEALLKFFDDNRGGDDSSTIAMRFFGFKDLDELKEFAKARLEVLQKEYLDKMPDLFTENYENRYEEVVQQNQRAARALLGEFKGNEKVLEYYKEQAIAEHQANFDVSLEEVEGRLIDLRALALKYMEGAEVKLVDGEPAVTPFKETENKDEVFEELAKHDFMLESREPFEDSDHAVVDAKIIKAIMYSYHHYKKIRDELEDVNKAMENAPKFLEEEFNAKGGKALLAEYVKAGIYTDEEAKVLLLKAGVNDEDVAALEEKMNLQKELFAKYDANYESIMKKEE